MLKQQLQQRLQQKLSPQQIQVIRMLEVPTLELEERIRQELEVNPALEEGKDVTEDRNAEDEMLDFEESEHDDFDIEEYINDDEIPDYKLRSDNYSQEEKNENIPFSSKGTFREHLMVQLGEQTISDQMRQLVEYIIGNIDEEGYLRREIEPMVDDMAFQFGTSVTEEQMQKALSVVQGFDPAGVGARTLKECLVLQLKRKKENVDIFLAKKILTQFFDEFSKKQYDKIIKRLNITEPAMRHAINEILKLNPKPGNTWESGAISVNEQITPDFLLENINGRLVLSLNNQNIPELHISPVYSEMVNDYVGNKKNQTKDRKNAILFAKQKIDSARWFIDAIRQRNTTLLTTMEAILKFQQDFFACGDETQLKPMILKDIAEITGFDISTISRVSNSKYVQTEFGIFQLRYFFSETMKTDSGEEISNKEVKRILQECVEAEDKRNPITDDKLMEVLKEKGYVIARRTVAKYREQIGIPVARLRKKI